MKLPAVLKLMHQMCRILYVYIKMYTVCHFYCTSMPKYWRLSLLSTKHETLYCNKTWSPDLGVLCIDRPAKLYNRITIGIVLVDGCIFNASIKNDGQIRRKRWKQQMKWLKMKHRTFSSENENGIPLLSEKKISYKFDMDCNLSSFSIYWACDGAWVKECDGDRKGVIVLVKP